MVGGIQSRMAFHSGLVDTHDLFKGSSAVSVLFLILLHISLLTILFSHTQKHDPIAAPYNADNIRGYLIL